MELTGGVVARPEETLLVRRAAEFLTQGPTDAAAIVAHVCNLPCPPPAVADRLAAAIMGSRPEFVRRSDGKWRLADGPRLAPTTASEDGPVPEPLASLTFAVVDVETTGGQPYAGDRITEIGVAVVRDGSVSDYYESLVNPQRPIPPFITRLTNITWDMVAGAPTFAEIAPRVVAAISGHVFAAHNATFDWRFLSAELSRAAGQRIDGRRLCTVRLARRLLPRLQRRSLDSLARYYGIEIERRHRAGDDALATARCLVRLLADARDRGCETWDDLQRIGRRPSRRRRRRPPGGPSGATTDASA